VADARERRRPKPRGTPLPGLGRFDRDFVVFLEALRQSAPPGTRGVAILGPPREGAHLFLASYYLAPVPILTSPRRVPPRWIPVSYGAKPPPGWRVFAPLPGGALLEPAL
jgi:hypothetical protein